MPTVSVAQLSSPAGTAAVTHLPSDHKGPSHSRTAKSWVISYSDKSKESETLSSNRMAQKAGRTGPGLAHHMKKAREAREARCRYVTLLFFDGDKEDNVQWTATLDAGGVDTTGTYQASVQIITGSEVPSRGPTPRRPRRTVILNSPSGAASQTNDSTTTDHASLGCYVEASQVSTVAESAQLNGSLPYFSFAKKWVVWRMSGHVKLKELQHWSTAHLQRITGATMHAIVGPMRKAREDNRNGEVSLIFHAPGDRTAVLLIANLDLEVEGGNRTFNDYIQLGQNEAEELVRQNENEKEGSLLRMTSVDPSTSAIASEQTYNATLSSNLDRSTSVHPSIDSVHVAQSVDLLAEARQADRLADSSPQGSRLWPEFYVVARAAKAAGDLQPGSSAEISSDIMFGLETMWQSLNFAEREAFGKLGMKGLKTVLATGAANACERNVGDITLTINRLSCMQFVEARAEKGMEPEQIIGELRTFGGNDPKGVHSWVCYRFGEFKKEGTDFHGFAIGTGSLFRATSVRPLQVHDLLKDNGTQAIFKNAQGVQWRIRRIGWHSTGVPLQGWECEEV